MTYPVSPGAADNTPQLILYLEEAELFASTFRGRMLTAAMRANVQYHPNARSGPGHFYLYNHNGAQCAFEFVQGDDAETALQDSIQRFESLLSSTEGPDKPVKRENVQALPSFMATGGVSRSEDIRVPRHSRTEVSRMASPHPTNAAATPTRTARRVPQPTALDRNSLIQLDGRASFGAKTTRSQLSQYFARYYTVVMYAEYIDLPEDYQGQDSCRNTAYHFVVDTGGQNHFFGVGEGFKKILSKSSQPSGWDKHEDTSLLFTLPTPEDWETDHAPSSNREFCITFGDNDTSANSVYVRHLKQEDAFNLFMPGWDYHRAMPCRPEHGIRSTMPLAYAVTSTFLAEGCSGNIGLGPRSDPDPGNSFYSYTQRMRIHEYKSFITVLRHPSEIKNRQSQAFFSLVAFGNIYPLARPIDADDEFSYPIPVVPAISTNTRQPRPFPFWTIAVVSLTVYRGDEQGNRVMLGTTSFNAQDGLNHNEDSDTLFTLDSASEISTIPSVAYDMLQNTIGPDLTTNLDNLVLEFTFRSEARQTCTAACLAAKFLVGSPAKDGTPHCPLRGVRDPPNDLFVLGMSFYWAFIIYHYQPRVFSSDTEPCIRLLTNGILRERNGDLCRPEDMIIPPSPRRMGEGAVVLSSVRSAMR